MNDVLANAYFKDFIIPLLSVFLTIAVKVVSRKDLFMKTTKEDWAIGFDLAVTALILLVSYCSKCAIDIHQTSNPNAELYKKKLEFLPWILFFYILGLWALSTLVRRYGWEQSQNKELKIFWGVVIPDIVGLLGLLFIVNYID